MTNEIIATVDMSGNLVSLLDTQAFVLYKRTLEGWYEAQKFSCEHMPNNAGEVRNIVKNMMSRFNDCRIIVSKNISGIAYQILNRHGFHIFEMNGLDDLDGVMLEIEKAQNEAQAQETIHKEPFSTENNGDYFLNLIELQNAYPEISSKKALKRFVEEEVFVKLEFICHHMPPWMEEVLMRRGFESRVEYTGENMCKVLITKNTCQ
jgi:Fe-only nitrogenase accessory protein AnfO